MRVTALVVGVTVISLGFALGGCSDSNKVILHKPGVYKGAMDPLIEKQRSPAQQEKLVSRFNQVQTDR
jgi:hypothetical protein